MDDKPLYDPEVKGGGFGKHITRKNVRQAKALLARILREYRKAEKHQTGSILTGDFEYQVVERAELLLGDIDHSLDAEFSVKKTQ